MTTVATALIWVLVALGALAWFVSGLAIALLVCKGIRNADRQTPRDQ